MTTIILLVMGFLLGLIVRPMLTGHKHDWEVVFHDNLGTNNELRKKLTFSYTLSMEEKIKNFVLEASKVNVTYKKCRKCGEVDIDIQSLGRTCNFDFDVVKSQLDSIIAAEKEKEDKKLIDAMNARIGLTSPEVPYNPEHEHEQRQQNPPKQVHHRGENAH